jgi:hypothetical protein
VCRKNRPSKPPWPTRETTGPSSNTRPQEGTNRFGWRTESRMLDLSKESSNSETRTCQTVIGCCGWSEVRNKYFADFTAIEFTFYEPPSLTLASRWRTVSPDSFVFCLKAWQLITHTASSPPYRKLKSKLSAEENDLVGSFRPTEQVALAWERTAAVARTLEASVVLFQCPASFLRNETGAIQVGLGAPGRLAV